jgi:hypothetical protein
MRGRGGCIMLKAQAAMEYLMTYSWAILIVSVVMGTLFSIGVFSGLSLSTACVSSVGYTCQNPVLSTNGLITIQLGEVGSTITITDISCTIANSPPSFSPITPVELPSGTSTVISFSCPLSSNKIGASFSGTLWIRYDTATQSGLQAAAGEVTAKATVVGS